MKEALFNKIEKEDIKKLIEEITVNNIEMWDNWQESVYWNDVIENKEVHYHKGDITIDHLNIKVPTIIDGNLTVTDLFNDCAGERQDENLVIVLGNLTCKRWLGKANMFVTGNINVGETAFFSPDEAYLSIGGNIGGGGILLAPGWPSHCIITGLGGEFVDVSLVGKFEFEEEDKKDIKMINAKEAVSDEFKYTTSDQEIKLDWRKIIDGIVAGKDIFTQSIRNQSTKN